MSQIPYGNVVDSLMYTMVCTRPDITQAISVASRYMGDPGKDHWNALKWIMSYLMGTQNHGLLLRRKEGFNGDPITSFVDSDIFHLYGTNVSWRSFLQSVVTLSTTEAEYMAMTEAVKDGVWLVGMLSDFGIKQKAVTILCDSQSALHLSKHQVFHERSKHIDVRHHFVRDWIDKGLIKVVKVSTNDNAVDMLTSPLPTAKFKFYLELTNLASLK